MVGNPGPSSSTSISRGLLFVSGPQVGTVWRNFDANAEYKIINKGDGLVLEVKGEARGSA